MRGSENEEGKITSLEKQVECQEMHAKKKKVLL